jgi:hypothetical protein
MSWSLAERPPVTIPISTPVRAPDLGAAQVRTEVEDLGRVDAGVPARVVAGDADGCSGLLGFEPRARRNRRDQVACG